MDILFLTSAHNSLSQRLWVELTEQQYRVQVVVVGGPADMEAAVQQHRPDLVLCPMLTARIPDTVWRNYPCLIVHPGVVGDRGPSSLDWALMEGESRWGVTVLQAIDEMDAGPVWASQEFALPPGLQRKSSLYRHQVTEAAVIAVQEALARFKAGEQPRPLAEFPAARGQLKPQMRQQDRQIHWHQDSPQTVVRKVAAADSRPGVRARLAGQELWLFGAWQDDSLQGEPGALLARHGEAVAVGCAGGGVWLTHLMTRQGPLADIKLPALRVLNNPALPVREDAPCREIRYRRDGDVGVLSFPFYNGAMGTEQCLALRDAYREACAQPTRALILEGGEDFFSNGIHLNWIEAADDPAEESWRNIQAMDDLVLAILTTDEQWVVSGLMGNAGAGGAMLALAADQVLARHSVILSPHYCSMGGLYGSEYWTYLLPRRVGAEKAAALTQECLPLGALQARELGLVDGVFTGDAGEFRRWLHKEVADKVADRQAWLQCLIDKQHRRQHDEMHRPLASYREAELLRMYENFFGVDRSYHLARRQFVRGCQAVPSTVDRQRRCG